MNENNPIEEIVLLTDKQWSIIDGETCRVVDFIPMNFDKSVPYACITIECKKVGKIRGYITHRTDFKHLFMAFKERTIKENEEVLIFWSKEHYKLKLLTLLHNFLPKLRVMICKKGAFNLITNSSYKPELQGEARFHAEKPIVDLKPEIME